VYRLVFVSGVDLRDQLTGIGFGDRLLNEVKKLALKDVKLKIYAPPERKVSWMIGKSHGADVRAVFNLDWWKYPSRA
jgi:hypothetical protein